MARRCDLSYLCGMNLRLLVALALMLLPRLAGAQRDPAGAGVTGLWLTQDHGGVISVMPCGSAVCARLVGVVLDHPFDAMPVDYRGVSQCGLELITDARQVRPGLWKGHIRDPRNGGVYGADLKLDSQGRLAMRGFLGVPLLGHTETWTRYNGRVPPDCRLRPGPGGTAGNQRPT